MSSKQQQQHAAAAMNKLPLNKVSNIALRSDYCVTAISSASSRN